MEKEIKMVPLRSSNLKYAVKWPKFIIIHHTAELDLGASSVQYDVPRFQSDSLKIINHQKFKTEMPYNFIIEQVKNDYEIVFARPILTETDFFKDIDRMHKSDIHIALLGSYNEDVPSTRLYDVMAYRLVNPLLRLFNLTDDRIVTHSEISAYEDQDCPGEHFSKAKLITSVKKYMKRRSVTRR